MADATLITHRNLGAKAALVFLHGFSGDAAKTWGHFPAFVSADPRFAGWDVFSVGYTTRLVPDIVGIWSADAPLDRLSLQLSNAASVAPLSTYKTLAFTAHSMGGLILQRALLDTEALSDRTSHVTLYGTPSGGLSKAGPFSFLKRQVRDMAESSDFIRSLRSSWKSKLETNAPFRFTTVAGSQDEFVPSTSSLDPFALPTRKVVPGNHLEIVKPDAGTDLSVKTLFAALTGDASDSGPRNAAAVALESRDFVRALKLLEDHKSDLDAQGAVELALALDGLGRQEEAIAFLESYKGTETDPMGVLAGRLKRRWLTGHRRSDAERTMELYQKAYEISSAKGDHAQAYYHGINVAFMELAYGSDLQAARAMAKDVLKHCSAAPKTQWRIAAEGEAHLILGETAIAMDAYRSALAMNPKPREVSSMFQQALQVADLVGDEAATDQLTAIIG